MSQFEKETQAMRPVSQAVNNVLGADRLPEGPFNFGLYFNKWLFVVDGRFSQKRLPKKGWACCSSDETKLVLKKEKICDPNSCLDNFDAVICLFNEKQKYSRRVPIEKKKRDGSIEFAEEERQVAVKGEWSRGCVEKLLSAKHNALDKLLTVYRDHGYVDIKIRGTLLASLVTGLGSEHPTEKGFRFDWNMGVPFIPATGLKGVVRLSYLVSRLNEFDEDKAKIFWTKINDGLLEADDRNIFGCGEDSKHDQAGRRGEVIFFDAYPEKLPRLQPEIMNCHYPDYLNDSGKRGPTEDQQPNPQKYWAVSPWLDDDRTQPLHFIFRMLVPKSNAESPNFENFYEAVQNALSLHGLGAKTAVGHGRFSVHYNTAVRAVNDLATLPEHNATPTTGSLDPQAQKETASPPISKLNKLLDELQLIGSTDMGRLGTIIQRLDELDTKEEKAALSEAIRNKLGPKGFKKHKRRDELLSFIELRG